MWGGGGGDDIVRTTFSGRAKQARSAKRNTYEKFAVPSTLYKASASRESNVKLRPSSALPRAIRSSRSRVYAFESRPGARKCPVVASTSTGTERRRFVAGASAAAAPSAPVRLLAAYE